MELKEKQLQDVLDAVLLAYTKSGELDEKTKTTLRNKLNDCAVIVENELSKLS